MRPAGVIETAAQPPEPPIRLSLKYVINALFSHWPVTILNLHGSPRELNDGAVTSGSTRRPKSVFVIAAGAPSPVGVGIGVIGASSSAWENSGEKELESVGSLVQYTSE